jgi:hypothetical protein
MTFVTTSASFGPDDAQQDSSFEWKTLVGVNLDGGKYQELIRSILRWWVLFHEMNSAAIPSFSFTGKIFSLGRSRAKMPTSVHLLWWPPFVW